MDVSEIMVVAKSRRAHVIGCDATLGRPSNFTEGTMNDHNRAPSQQVQEKQRVARNLHSMVYIALVGLVLWLVLAIWGFGYDGQTDYLLAIVTGFLLIAVAIPATLALMAYSQGNSVDGESSAPHDTKSFRQWAAEDFDTWQDRVK